MLCGRLLSSMKVGVLVVWVTSLFALATSQNAGATQTGPDVILSSHVALGRSTAMPKGSLPRDSDAYGTAAAAPTPDGQGFWTVTGGGSVSVQGDAVFYGDASELNLNGSIVGIAPTSDGRGYWLLGSDGGVFSYGDAKFYGSTGALHLNAPALQMVSTPDSRGYWFVAADGGIFTFGDAKFFGSTGNLHLNQPVVGMATTHDGQGYWLVASDGGIFSFGDAKFQGSTGATSLNEPVVGMAATSDSQGYWLVASDGGIFSFGDAKFQGSTGATSLNEPVVGMAATSDSRGYWLVAADGGIFAFGDAGFYGSASSDATPGSIVSIVATGDGGGYWVIGDDGNIYSYGDAATTGGSAPPTGIATSPEYLGETSALDVNDFVTDDSVHEVNGVTYTQCVYAEWNSFLTDVSSAQWNLGRAYNWLDATIGFDDSTVPSDETALVQVFGDGTQLYSQTVALGEDFPIHLDVSGVLRLELEVTPLTPPSGNSIPELVFGSAEVTP
jgi:hypothetical protein